MKKRHGLSRAMPVTARAELEKLPTRVLLARLKRLQWLEESPDQSDLSEAEIVTACGQILFKSDAKWRSAYFDLREILASREHIENKAQKRK